MRIKEIFIGGFIGAIMGILLTYLVGAPIDDLFISLGIINSPEVNIEVHEFKLTASNGILQDKKQKESLGDIFWRDSYLFYVIDIKNERTSDKFINNFRTQITVNGTIFKIKFNVVYEDKCKVERPNEVKFNYDGYYRKSSPLDDVTIRKPTSIKGSRSLIISCDELAPGEIISLHVYADSKGICNYRCGYGNLGFFSEYWWQSYNKINPESFSGKIIK